MKKKKTGPRTVTLGNYNRKLVTVEVPKEIWDADRSFYNQVRGRKVMKAWIESLRQVVEQLT
jgi:hypothetical protein